MLYKRAGEKELEDGLFQSPGKEYRGAPFWAWNCRLDKEVLLKEIQDLKAMGMGGAHIHCRVGLDTPYLGEEFFSLVKDCKEKMQQEDMLCWLYDEDRWPSGSAGGMVTKEKKYRARFLVFEPAGYEETEEEAFMAAAKAVRSRERRVLGRYRIALTGDGCLKNYEKVDNFSKNTQGLWTAYLEISGDTPWFNDQAYVNTLDPEAVKAFLEATHEKYYERFSQDFGNEIPAIFTDEPQTSHKECLAEPFEERPVILPFTDDLEESFQKTYHCSLLEALPELIWEKENGEVSQIRYFYHRHVMERFSQAFGDQVGAWCENHGIALTGHMMNEWTLHSQTMAIGEVMRPMKAFGLPGIDMLCGRRELSTAKQAASIARQMGREGVMSEIYGVTGWHYEFRDHKLAGDWQAALGVTLRVPHLSWVSMEGEAKRDYPASFGCQSAWYREYPYIEDHFARLNTALTRGKAQVSVGVIHPIESYWMYWGNQKQTAGIRQNLEEHFERAIQWLLYGLMDFDFISEAVLAEEEKPQQGNTFLMGEMAYEAVVVPECHTLRASTLERLEAFKAAGGRIFFLGEIPKYVDGKRSGRPFELAKACHCISYNKYSLLKALEPFRQVEVQVTPVDGTDPTRMKHRENGLRAANMFYQLLSDGEEKWLFLSHVNPPVNEHITYTEKAEITIKGSYQPILYDTMTGEKKPLKARIAHGKTTLTWYGSAHDSLLLRLLPQEKEETTGEELTYQKPGEKKLLDQPEAFSMAEPNVLLLDMAEYAFDEGPWQQEEELLRIDNLFRKKLGYPLRMEALAQPWTKRETKAEEHQLRLRFRIFAAEAQKNCALAMERPQKAEIRLNGTAIEKRAEGWFVDRSIQILPLGDLPPGEHLLEMTIPFGEKTNIEWCYLLGEFGVQVLGRRKELVSFPKRIYYGDITRQGLPFYGGNITYKTTLSCERGRLFLEISHYRGALIKVRIDGEEKGVLSFAPYRLDCGLVEKGTHKVEITLFGTRSNTFGPLHNADETETWYGPNLWRTQDQKWSYEYQLREAGILTAPCYFIETEIQQ